MATLPKCSICGRPVPPRALNKDFPFCSPRCRAVDLGKWLGEEYRVPDARMDEPEDARSSGSGVDADIDSESPDADA